MGIARSTFYDEPTAAHDDTVIVEAIAAGDVPVSVEILEAVVAH